MKRLAVLLALLLAAAPASARDWYVSPTGTGGGATVGDPCALNTANVNADAGDFVYLATGTYAGQIYPGASGDADDGKIAYIGTTGTTVLGIVLTSSYISVSNVASQTSVTFSGARDSLTDVTITGTLNADADADYFRALRVTTTSDSLYQMNFGAVGTDYVVGGRLDSCSFTLRHTRAGWGSAVILRNTDQLAVTSCAFDISIGATATQGMMKLYNSRSGVWTDNTIDFTSYNPWTSGDECNRCDLRDSTRNNRFLRTHWRFNGSNPYQWLISASGNDSSAHSVRNNTFYECSWRSEGPIGCTGLLWFQAGANRDTLAYCTVVSAYGSPLGFTQNISVDSLALVHNTFVKVAPDTLSGAGAPFYVTPTQHIIGSEAFAGTATVTNNIFYAAHTDYSLTGANSTLWNSGTNISGGRWAGDYNLLWGQLGPDSALYVGGSPCDSTCLRSTHSVETNSIFGSPLFVDGTPTVASAMSFDVSLRPESPCIGRGSSGSDIGAVAYAALADSFTVYYLAGTGGTISCAACNLDGDGDAYQRVAYGEDAAVVEAEADSHYSFLAWSDGDPDFQRQDLSIAADTSYTAYFVIDSFTVAYSAGTGGTIVGTAYQRVAYGGDADTVIASPNTGYDFSRWLPDSLTSALRADTTVTADTAFTATFTKKYYTLTYTWATGGTLECPDCFSPPGATNLQQTVQYGSDAYEVTAIPSTGWDFSRWSDGLETAARTDDSVSSSFTVQARFAVQQFTLAYTAGTGGTISGTASQNILYGQDGTTVTAIPSSGYGFYSWSDSLKVEARRDTDVVANVAVSAIFNSIATPAGAAEIALSATDAYIGSTKVFTIANGGTDSLHVYSITLYHRQGSRLREVSCTKSASTPAIAADESLNVTLSNVVLRSRLLPYYRLTVVSDAGTRSLNWTYDPCR